jgi:glycosyltransferase involved in cell wall biosynthesis
MNKLIILPGSYDTLGGTLITLSLLVNGFENLNKHKQILVLAPSESLITKYFEKLGRDYCLVRISSNSQSDFFKKALEWIFKQDINSALMLDNCVYNYLLLTFLTKSIKLRFSGIYTYHFCHDLAPSNNIFGYFARKLIFGFIAPKAICNSSFTAKNIRHLMPNIQGIIYQPVDFTRFNDTSVDAPLLLQPIIESGYRIMLTPSRISSPGISNDKNLTILISIVAYLKAVGHKYHAVVIGEDKSPNQLNTSNLINIAKELKVSDYFTILPPVFNIEDYYKHADVVVTLAPREPFGRTVIEAIACGIPVVGSSTGGIGEILRNFAPEWMVDPNNIQEAARAIIQVASDSNTSEVLAQAKAWVETECSVETYARKMIEFTHLDSSDRTKPLSVI